MSPRSDSAVTVSRVSPACVCEPLEGRQLLAADLVASQLIGNLPASLVSGQRGKVPALRVVVTNSGTADATAQNFVVRLFASTNGTLESPGDFQIAETSRKLRLRPGKTLKIPIKVRDIPADIPNASYQLIAQVDATDQVVEDNAGNNNVASTGTIQIGPPFVNLTVSDLVVGKGSSVIRGRPGRFILTVLNAGNVTAKGTGAVNLTFTRLGDSTSTPVNNVPVKLNLKALQRKLVKGVVAPIPAGLAEGQYTVTATIASTVGFQETNPSDNSATATPVSVG